MLRLNRYTLALVLWLSFLFNVERLDLDISSPDLFNISFPMYITTVALALVGLLLPQWRRMPIILSQLVAVVAFAVASSLDDRPSWGGGYTYLSLFELSSCLITLTLAYIVGRLTVDFLDTVRAMLFADGSSRVYDIKDADTLLKLEMRSARRANRPLSVVLLEAKAEDSKALRTATAQEIQQLMVKRCSIISLARMLSKSIRTTDFVVDQSESGHLVLVVPEATKSETYGMLDRLTQIVQRRLGVSVNYGVASFPQQGATFEELVFQAQQQLDGNPDLRRDEEMVERRGRITEQYPVIDEPVVVEVNSD